VCKLANIQVHDHSLWRRVGVRGSHLARSMDVAARTRSCTHARHVDQRDKHTHGRTSSSSAKPWLSCWRFIRSLAFLRSPFPRGCKGTR
jgi:hypothetical protein